jgi:hypothetical protein
MPERHTTALPPLRSPGSGKGTTYYAYDISTSTYWAGASLVPNPSSYEAGVVVQDDGAYLIFDQTAHGAWRARDVGYSDTVGDCAAYHVSIPAAVVAVWHWVPGTCHPPTNLNGSGNGPSEIAGPRLCPRFAAVGAWRPSWPSRLSPLLGGCRH